MTALDLHEPGALAERMQDARRRSAVLAGRRCSWTLQPPDGWWFTDTAEDRLARRDDLRARGYAV